MSVSPEVLVQIEPGRNKLGVFEDLRHVQENVGFVPTNEIARIAIKHDLMVLSDEAYFEMRYAGQAASIASLPGMAERTVIL